MPCVFSSCSTSVVALTLVTVTPPGPSVSYVTGSSRGRICVAAGPRIWLWMLEARRHRPLGPSALVVAVMCEVLEQVELRHDAGRTVAADGEQRVGAV